MRGLGAASAALFLSLLAPDALASGIVLGAGSAPESQPSVAREDVLIVHDATSQQEHLIQRITFERGNKPFGLLVPTPSEPVVSEFDEGIWERLGKLCSPDFYNVRLRAFGKAGAPARLGTDGGQAVKGPALAAWLERNRFTASAATRAWIDDHVRRGYAFAAFRYEGSGKQEPGEQVTKTLRLSFRSVQPYFPYDEPSDTPSNGRRFVDVWFVGSELMLPVAGVSRGGGERLIRRPWSESRCSRDPKSLPFKTGDAEVDKSIPAGGMLQVFADLKRTRAGWGDAFLAPKEARACDATCVNERLPLIEALVPSLGAVRLPSEQLAFTLDQIGRGAGAAPKVPKPPPKPRAPASSGPCGCRALGATGSLRGAFLAPLLLASVLGIFQVRRRPRTRRLSRRLGRGGLGLGLVLTLNAPRGAATDLVPVPREVDSVKHLDIPTRGPAAPRAILEVLLGNRWASTWVWSVDPGDRSGLLATSWLGPSLDPKEESVRCGIPGLEAVLSFRLEFRNGLVEHVELTGPAPPVVLNCLQKGWLAWPASNTVGASSEGQLWLGNPRDELLDFGDEVPLGQIEVAPIEWKPGTTNARVRAGTPVVNGELPAEVIARIVRQNFGRFRQCYEEGLGRNPTLRGKVSVRLVIGRDGSVANAANGGSDLPDPAVVSCVLSAFHGLSFPAPEGGTVKVTFPIMFEPG